MQTVLLVSQDPAARANLVRRLRGRYEVRRADASRACRDAPAPDLVIVEGDADAPEGRSILRRLRARFGQLLPLVVVPPEGDPEGAPVERVVELLLACPRQGCCTMAVSSAGVRCVQCPGGTGGRLCNPAWEAWVDEVPRPWRPRRLAPDDCFAGYLVVEVVARSELGALYRARELESDRSVGLKTLETREPESALRDRFRRGARALARLRHPNVPRVQGYGVWEGVEYCAADFVEGASLEERLLAGPLPAAEAVATLLPLVEALGHAHASGVLHHDVKPTNVVLAPDGSPHLVDFGLATWEGAPPDEGEFLLGTAAYMAPEYLQGHAYDERADLYSFGVVLYEALAGLGRVPFPETDRMLLLDRVARRAPIPLGHWVPDLDPGLAGLVAMAIAGPDVRYRSADALASALRRWLATARGEPRASP